MPSPFTRDNTGWSNAAQDRVEMVDADPMWPEQFELEAAALRSALTVARGVRIEHFGSTAVPDLTAKPIIDMLLIHPKRGEWPQFIKPLQDLGYVYWAENPRQDRMFFVKGMPPFGQRRTHHVHIRMPEDAERELRFRDLLRADAALARDYGRLKQDLARRYPTDRDAYTDGKTKFISRALSQRSVRV